MEDTDPANLTLNMSYGSVDTEEYLHENCSSVPNELIAFACVGLGVSLCGLVGNGMVVWFLGFRMRQSPFTVYILNLAVADFSMTLLLFLLLAASVTVLASCLLHLVLLYSDFAVAAALLCHVCDLCSLGVLAALSVERCLSVHFPVWYRCRRPRHLSGCVCGALWALAASAVCSLYATFTLSDHSREVVPALVVAFSAVLSLLMLISNVLLCTKLCRGSPRRYPGRLFVVILLNVLLFFAFGVPFCLDVFLHLPGSGQLFPGDAVPLLLALLDCSLNPVLYVLVGSCRRRRCQRSLGAALRRAFEERPASAQGTGVPGDSEREGTAL